jgi:hypothetical protein
VKIVKREDVKTLPRGRKATFNPELLATLKKITGTNFGVLDDEFGVVAPAKRQAVSAEIRKHWAQVHTTKCSVQWSPDGFAQVGAAKADA